MQGTQAAQGTAGTFAGQGVQGVQGVQGRDGAFAGQGVQGVQGVQGTQGTQGISGAQGNTSAQGVQGVQGVQGISGSFAGQGVQGTTGAQGTQGVTGAQGVQGVSTKISNGTSEANIVAPNGDLVVTISGVGNIGVFSTSGLTVAGFVSATGNVFGVIGSLSGNVIGSNLLTGGYASAAGNVTTAASLLGTAVSVTGNLTSAGIVTTGAGGAISGTGTITGGGLSSTGNITASGNLGVGSSSAGFKVDVNGPMILSAANSEVRFNSGGAWIAGGTNTLYLGTGLRAVSANAKATLDNNGNLSLTGALVVNSATTGIVNAAGNGVGNIGATGAYFNQVFAQATTALYADLAEVYEADADYTPGTVMVFGGNKEVTMSTVDSSRRVAGVISDKPSYLMNNGLTADHRAIVALTGRVPTLVFGNVAKGDMMVSAGNGRARAEENPLTGAIIGKALEDFTGLEGMIEIVVGRL